MRKIGAKHHNDWKEIAPSYATVGALAGADYWSNSVLSPENFVVGPNRLGCFRDSCCIKLVRLKKSSDISHSQIGKRRAAIFLRKSIEVSI